MNYKTVHNIYFSPSGSTKKITNIITEGFTCEKKRYDLLEKGVLNNLEFASDDVIIVGMPVFGGRIPNICVEMLRGIHGNKTSAIAVVSYGNRDYEDALLELQELLEKKGFIVIGAGAFIARHSIFNKIASERPDNNDIIGIEKFSLDCVNKIEMIPNNYSQKLNIKGNHPYKVYNVIPLIPTGDSECNNCGLCVKICPVNAISSESPRETNEKRCISCTSCISVCPQKARYFSGEKYKISENIIEKKCLERKEMEVYI